MALQAVLKLKIKFQMTRELFLNKTKTKEIDKIKFKHQY
jgi:hypothetical protein